MEFFRLSNGSFYCGESKEDCEENYEENENDSYDDSYDDSHDDSYDDDSEISVSTPTVEKHKMIKKSRIERVSRIIKSGDRYYDIYHYSGKYYVPAAQIRSTHSVFSVRKLGLTSQERSENVYAMVSKRTPGNTKGRGAFYINIDVLYKSRSPCIIKLVDNIYKAIRRVF